MPTNSSLLPLCVWRSSAWLTAALVAASYAQPSSADENRISTQKPTIAAAETREAEAAEPAKDENAEAGASLLAKGPKVSWIWGADANTNYLLRAEFQGSAKVARVKATCDNVMTLFINGQRVASHDNWQTPIEADVTKHLKAGTNEVVAEVANQGGIAAFALKLAVQREDGKVDYLVSDDSWTAAAKSSPDQREKVRVVGSMGDSPWGDVFSQAGGIASVKRDVFNLLPGFQVELLYTVPKDQQGSWVSIAFDDKGRLLASDQGDKGLYRITPPPIGSDEPTRVESLPVKITGSQGMLHAFGSLYVSVNGGPGSGIYRLKDTTGDDQYDEVTKLKSIRGGGEHGPHALRLSP
ncbi:MAG: heme-binding protein, partial [Planctomycetales bacterium]|nr:heme-binding protein [Planctomycetales bacterium]